MINASRLIAGLAVFTILGISLVLAQPSLTPPAGPIDESGRFGTLIELNDDTAPGAGVYAHVITTPGSYILTGDIDAGSGGGVEIRAADVTLDLNGYTIRGTASPGAGVSVPEVLSSDVETPGITVRNGNIVGFLTGVRAFISAGGGLTSTSDGVRLDDLQVRATNTGIRARATRITNCAVVAPINGIRADFSVIDGCEVRLGGDTTASFVSAIIADNCSVSRTVVDMNPSTSSTRRGFVISRTIVSGSSAQGGEFGFVMGIDSVANGCVSTATSDFVDAAAETFNSNF